MSKNNLLPREYLYSAKYKKILPYLQDKEFSQVFNIGDKLYEGLRGKGLYVINTKTGKVFNDFSFNFEGYLKKNNMLGGLITPLKNMAKTKGVNWTGNVANFSQDINLGKDIVLFPQNSLLLQRKIVSGNKNFSLTMGRPVTPSISILLDPLYALNIKKNLNLANRNIVSDEILPQFSTEEKFEAKYLKPIPTTNLNSAKSASIEILNDMLTRLNYSATGKQLSVKKLNFYNNLSKEIYALGQNPQKITMEKLEKISEKIDILSSQKPLFVFYGYNLEDVLRPKSFPEEEFFTFNLANSSDYKKDVKEKIKLLSSIFDEYTIYTFIHGSKKGYLRLNKDKKAYITELAEIIDQNRDNSIVNWVSGSCHSGAGLNRKMVKPGLNILLISGVNDVCYDSDTRFVRVNDLISSYYDVVKAKRYGSVLIYNGKVFNSIVEAKNKIAKGNKETTNELNILSNIFYDGSKLGSNIFKLLISFPKWQTPSFSLEKLNAITDIPFIFNPKSNIFNFETYIAPPVRTNEDWVYEIIKFNAYGQKMSEKKISDS
ncbi:MAG: hypothetical protein IJJ58_03775 [Campylobacter sp.]|nr:hypothetical protein [Campylobacter sp.]